MVAPQRPQPAPEINLLEVGSILPVPFGTLPGVPLLSACQDAASLLSISKTRIRGIPFAADPAGSLSVSVLCFHRFLRRMTLEKTIAVFLSVGERKVDGA